MHAKFPACVAKAVLKPILSESPLPQALEQEMASPSALRHDAAGIVSLVVGEEKEREVKERLVAMGGKLVRCAYVGALLQINVGALLTHVMPRISGRPEFASQ